MNTIFVKHITKMSTLKQFSNNFGWVHTITKKHYIPESTFNYQKALRKHMQGGVWRPCLILFYVCWIIKMNTGGKNRYMILKCD